MPASKTTYFAQPLSSPGRQYEIAKSEEVLIYDLYVPDNLDYEGILGRVLNNLQDREWLLSDPLIAQYLSQIKSREPEKEGQFLDAVQRVAAGHTLIRGDGRFYIPGSKPKDERCVILRFIVKDPRPIFEETSEQGEPIYLSPGRMRRGIPSIADLVIVRLIAARFAKETEFAEREVWVMRQSAATLTRIVDRDPAKMEPYEHVLDDETGDTCVSMVYPDYDPGLSNEWLPQISTEDL